MKGVFVERLVAVGSWHPAIVIFDLLLTHRKDNQVCIVST